MDARNDAALTVTLPSDREIAMTRTFAAPRERVFAAWTRPEHVRRWYGCGATTMTVCEIDLRVGGAWRFVLRTQDGADHVLSGVYREIAPPERLVYTQRFATESFTSNESTVTMLLTEHNGKTRFTSTVVHQSVQDRDAEIKAGVETGAAATLDRLAELLVTLT